MGNLKYLVGLVPGTENPPISIFRVSFVTSGGKAESYQSRRLRDNWPPLMSKERGWLGANLLSDCWIDLPARFQEKPDEMKTMTDFLALHIALEDMEDGEKTEDEDDERVDLTRKR